MLPCSAIHFHSAIVDGKVTMTILSDSEAHSVTMCPMKKRKDSLEMLIFFLSYYCNYFYENID